jgi:hypothetical protein
MSGGKRSSEWQQLVKKVSHERKMGLKDAIQHIKTNGLYKKKGSGTVFSKKNRVQPAPPEPGPGHGPHYHTGDRYSRMIRYTELPEDMTHLIGKFADDEKKAANEFKDNRRDRVDHDANEHWRVLRDTLNGLHRPFREFANTTKGQRAAVRDAYITHKFNHIN